MYTDAMMALIECLKSLPGVGDKTAERLAYHMLRAPREEVLALSEAIRGLRERTRSCSVCHNVTEEDPCRLCTDPERDGTVVCVVEQPKDLYALERTGAYRGRYHVLAGQIAPLEGMHEEHLTMGSLVARVAAGGIEEVLIATNPTLEGDHTALVLAERLAGLPVRLTRIARGIPTGSAIEYASKAILEDALVERREISPSPPTS